MCVWAYFLLGNIVLLFCFFEGKDSCFRHNGENAFFLSRSSLTPHSFPSFTPPTPGHTLKVLIQNFICCSINPMPKESFTTEYFLQSHWTTEFMTVKAAFYYRFSGSLMADDRFSSDWKSWQLLHWFLLNPTMTNQKCFRAISIWRAEFACKPLLFSVWAIPMNERFWTVPSLFELKHRTLPNEIGLPISSVRALTETKDPH